MLYRDYTGNILYWDYVGNIFLALLIPGKMYAAGFGFRV